jgi:hypothetical protein
MLVLLIGSSILLFSIKQYEEYKMNQNAIALKSTVDSILQSMSYYYQANCQNGTLSPTVSSFPPPPVFDNAGALWNVLNQGFLPANWQGLNPIVDNAAPNQGYSVQFNYFQSTKPSNPGRNTKVCYNFWSSGTANVSGCGATPAPIPDSIIIGWQIQVTVKMKDPTSTMDYAGLAGADCAVTDLTPNTVADCSHSGTGPFQYLVWQRLPAFASPTISSPLWLTTPMVKQFNEAYTHDPMYEIFMNGTSPTSYYYLCGS